MLFYIENPAYKDPKQLYTSTMMSAFFVVKNFPLKATDILLDNHLKAKYNIDLKKLCVKILLSLSYYCNEKNDIILLFKEKQYDNFAQLITYGNGAVPGSKILKYALKG